MTKVQWPDGAYGQQDDLSEPIQALLRDLRLLEQPGDTMAPTGGVATKLRNETPVSLQVLTAGATSLSKVTASWVAGLGGASAVLGTGLAFLTAPENTELVRVLVPSIAAVISISVLALAIIVRADLQARSTATAAEYAARAETAAALLRGSSTRPSPPPEPRYWTKTSSGEVFPVKGLEYKGRQIWLDTGGRQLTQDEIDCITPY